MHILISPDKFKSSLTAFEVCEAIERGVRQVLPEATITKLPLADGGEGTLEILESNLLAERVEMEVSDPLFRPVKAYYLRKGTRAYIEMAKASGLPLLKNHEKSAMKTSTYGTGELIRHAVEQGAREVFVMIGGSATNDGGCGMAEAMGAEFFASQSKRLNTIRGRDLSQVKEVNLKPLEIYKGVKFSVLSDVQNPLIGTQGASYVFGKQKGASESEIEKLDKGLEILAAVLRSDKENLPGAGAAGGLGYGLMTFLGAELKSGIEQVMELIDYTSAIQNVDLIITGEGKLDSQTLGGKVIAGVIQQGKSHNIPVGILCGAAENVEQLKSSLGTLWIYQVREKASSFKDSMLNANKYLELLTIEFLQAYTKA